MTAKTAKDLTLSVPPPRLCQGASHGNSTCAAQMNHFLPPFSSTFALVVLAALLVGIIFVSLATFHFHKRKLRKRKIQRAQEEYERDSRSPVIKREPMKPCIIVRPVSRDTESSTGAAASPTCDAECPLRPVEESDSVPLPTHHVSDEDISMPDQVEGPMLHIVVSS